MQGSLVKEHFRSAILMLTGIWISLSPLANKHVQSEHNLYDQRFLNGGRTNADARKHTHIFPRALPGFLIGRSTFSACAALSAMRWGHSGCSVERLASLQRLSRTFQWETAGWQAGRLLVNRPNDKQQRRLYIIPTEIKKKTKKKIRSEKELTPVILSLTILPQFVNTKKARLMYPWRAALLILLQYLESFTGISAHLTAPIVVNVVFNGKKLLYFLVRSHVTILGNAELVMQLYSWQKRLLTWFVCCPLLLS